MKFGKEFKKQKVPEWTEAYMDYNGLKRILQEIWRFKQSKQPSTPLRALRQRSTRYRAFSGLNPQTSNFQSEGDIEDQVIAVNTVKREDSRKLYNTDFLMSPEEGQENEINFFKKLDNELNKVNTFYKDKVEEVIREAALLNKQMDALIALRIKVENQDSDEPSSLRNLSVDIDSAAPSRITTESRVRTLEMQHMDSNLEAEMVSKCQPDESTANSSSLCQEEVNANKYEPAPLEVLDHVKINNPLESPRSTIKGILNDSKEEDLCFNKKELKKVEERLKQVLIEFYQKLRLLKHYSFMNLSAFSKIMKKYEKITSRSAARSYMKVVDNSYLGSSEEVNGLLDGVEVTFIKYFSNCNRRAGMKLLRPKLKREKHRITFFSGFFSGFSIALVVAVGTELGYREVFLLSTGLAVLALTTFLVILVITFCPFHIIYSSSRFFLLQTMFHCICAPLYTVSLPDFFLADQLTSQVQAIRSIEFYTCYYGWGVRSQTRNKCHSHDVYNVFYIIVAVIPYWIRFLQMVYALQCLRRLFEDRDMVHSYNGLRYFLTIIAVVIRTCFELKKGLIWKVLTLVSSIIATMMNTYWDIIVDWGLLQRRSKNLFLRDKLVVSHKSVYFAAMILDIILRFAWLQLVLKFNLRYLRGNAISSLFSCLEIMRRGMWNFFRLENEHLNNVGKYRAFKSVPLPFNYYDDDENTDKDD
ncbi:hypothetical protein LguiB_024942 [Lonicera macranthoides]